MYTFKMLDVVLQGVSFVSGLLLWMIYNLYGYFYWISFGILCWIFLSMLLNFILVKPFPTSRMVISLIAVVIGLIFLASWIGGVSFSRLNFYFKPLSILIIITYFILSLVEMNKIKAKGDIDLDF